MGEEVTPETGQIAVDVLKVIGAFVILGTLYIWFATLGLNGGPTLPKRPRINETRSKRNP